MPEQFADRFHVEFSGSAPASEAEARTFGYVTRPSADVSPDQLNVEAIYVDG